MSRFRRTPSPPKTPTTVLSHSKTSVLRLRPHFFVHISDENKNTVRLLEGPVTYTLSQQESCVRGPEAMILVPPGHYARIANPVMRDKDGNPIKDSHGQVRLRNGDVEIVLHKPEPFALYPGEELEGTITPLKIVLEGQALRLEAIRNFEDTILEDNKPKKIKRIAGEQWYFIGPGTYIPRVEVAIKETVRNSIILSNAALKLRARRECIDCDGKTRKTGEEWLVRREGEYLPNIDEIVVGPVQAVVLVREKAVHLQAVKTFKDIYGVERKAGDEWLVTSEMSTMHIPDVYEKVMGEVRITELTSMQYCVILDPIDSDGKQHLGQKKMIVGPKQFFLQPGERLEKGIQDVFLLGEQEALLLRCKEKFYEVDPIKNKKVEREPGIRWMVYGPRQYVPPTQVEVIERRSSIPLNDNEGIYVRDLNTGKVSSVIGETYMLKPNEELWQKDLPPIVEKLIGQDEDALSGRAWTAKKQRRSTRDKTKVVTYPIPHNAAVQIYDYKKREARVQFGPDLAMLGPDEHFTLLSISGGKPKRPDVIQSVTLLLGPDFMTDIITVETSDHARLSLQLSYNWHFEVDKESQEDARKIFQVSDFVGDACKAIASKIRALVATKSFDEFHKGSARAIRIAVFGLDSDNHVNDCFRFESNNLVITNIDIQSVEPVDKDTLLSLQKSVQLAIKITSESQEAAAKHEAKRRETEAKGKLENLKIVANSQAEKKRKELLEHKAECAAISTTGKAKAEAQAKAEAAHIIGTMSVQQAQLESQTLKIDQESKRKIIGNRYDLDYTHQERMDNLDLEKAKNLSEIKSQALKKIVDAISVQTLQNIAKASPLFKSRILKGLGVRNYLITDGKSQINMFGDGMNQMNQMNPKDEKK
ncbi:major vault protein [Anaeramoeba ignava]|uniref:Major vault protein n=1 Tax=Anaeramoeba ignava TaxID=1746090 RepID=A0A9Q0LIY0_ANAIG|nr:major vault protein [Anaeramoeba ignava]